MNRHFGTISLSVLAIAIACTPTAKPVSLGATPSLPQAACSAPALNTECVNMSGAWTYCDPTTTSNGTCSANPIGNCATASFCDGPFDPTCDAVHCGSDCSANACTKTQYCNGTPTAADATKMGPPYTCAECGTDPSDGTALTACLAPYDGRASNVPCTYDDPDNNPPVGCKQVCTNTNSDPANCGGCGKPCTVVKPNCVNGACSVCKYPYCSDGSTCPSDTDPTRCGATCASCGNARDGTPLLCTAGVCDCPTGFTKCGRECVNLENDRANCGACGTKVGGTQTCVNGAPSDCSKTVCNNDDTCVDLTTDTGHCGDCSNACTDGYQCITTTCQSGDTACFTVNGTGYKCGCPAGTTHCPGNCPAGTTCPGVCANLAGDPNHCGTCTHVCAPTPAACDYDGCLQTRPAACVPPDDDNALSDCAGGACCGSCPAGQWFYYDANHEACCGDTCWYPPNGCTKDPKCQ